MAGIPQSLRVAVLLLAILTTSGCAPLHFGFTAVDKPVKLETRELSRATLLKSIGEVSWSRDALRGEAVLEDRVTRETSGTYSRSIDYHVGAPWIYRSYAAVHDDFIETMGGAPYCWTLIFLTSKKGWKRNALLNFFGIILAIPLDVVQTSATLAGDLAGFPLSFPITGLVRLGYTAGDFEKTEKETVVVKSQAETIPIRLVQAAKEHPRKGCRAQGSTLLEADASWSSDHWSLDASELIAAVSSATDAREIRNLCLQVGYPGSTRCTHFNFGRFYQERKRELESELYAELQKRNPDREAFLKVVRRYEEVFPDEVEQAHVWHVKIHERLRDYPRAIKAQRRLVAVARANKSAGLSSHEAKLVYLCSFDLTRKIQRSNNDLKALLGLVADFERDFPAERIRADQARVQAYSRFHQWRSAIVTQRRVVQHFLKEGKSVISARARVAELLALSGEWREGLAIASALVARAPEDSYARRVRRFCNQKKLESEGRSGAIIRHTLARLEQSDSRELQRLRSERQARERKDRLRRERNEAAAEERRRQRDRAEDERREAKKLAARRKRDEERRRRREAEAREEDEESPNWTKVLVEGIAKEGTALRGDLRRNAETRRRLAARAEREKAQRRQRERSEAERKEAERRDRAEKARRAAALEEQDRLRRVEADRRRQEQQAAERRSRLEREQRALSRKQQAYDARVPSSTGWTDWFGIAKFRTLSGGLEYRSRQQGDVIHIQVRNLHKNYRIKARLLVTATNPAINPSRPELTRKKSNRTIALTLEPGQTGNTTCEQLLGRGRRIRRVDIDDAGTVSTKIR